MAQYTKTTHDYFPDFCDRVDTGRSPVDGSWFENYIPNLVSKSLTSTNILIGVENPRWRDQVRKGVDATTVMSASKRTVDAHRMALVINTSNPAGHPLNYTKVKLDGYPLYAYPSPSTVPSSALSDARNIALRKFFQRANAARTSVEGGQALGEWKETVRAITNPLSALRKFTINHVLDVKKRLKRLKRLNSKDPRVRRGVRTQRARAIAGAVSDTYLEFVFGWIPLAKDVQAAIAGLLDRYNHPDYQRVKGKAIVCWDLQLDENTIITINNMAALQSHVTQYIVDYRFMASIKTGAVNGVQSVSATLGLLPERFIPTVWELIPYSFVVDYFVNVGQIVEAYAFRRSIVNWGVRTIRLRTERVYAQPRIVNVSTIPDYYPRLRRLNEAGVYGGGATLTVESVDRIPLSDDTLMPDLDIHLPISSKPWYNLGAILTKNFVAL